MRRTVTSPIRAYASKLLLDVPLRVPSYPPFDRHPRRFDTLDQAVDEPIMQLTRVIPRDAQRRSDAIIIRIDKRNM